MQISSSPTDTVKKSDESDHRSMNMTTTDSSPVQEAAYDKLEVCHDWDKYMVGGITSEYFKMIVEAIKHGDVGTTYGRSVTVVGVCQYISKHIGTFPNLEENVRYHMQWMEEDKWLIMTAPSYLLGPGPLTTKAITQPRRKRAMMRNNSSEDDSVPWMTHCSDTVAAPAPKERAKSTSTSKDEIFIADSGQILLVN